MTIQDLDVRLNNDDEDTRRERAAKSTCRFLRRQAEMRNPADKVELAQIVWDLYWEFKPMLAAPNATRSMLRSQYGYWKSI